MYYIGLIMSYFSGILFPGTLMNMFAIGGIPSIIQILLMLFTQVEPPIYIAKKGKLTIASTNLKIFYQFSQNNNVNKSEVKKHLYFQICF
jgi:hypothetical protein